MRSKALENIVAFRKISEVEEKDSTREIMINGLYVGAVARDFMNRIAQEHPRLVSVKRHGRMRNMTRHTMIVFVVFIFTSSVMFT